MRTISATPFPASRLVWTAMMTHDGEPLFDFFQAADVAAWPVAEREQQWRPSTVVRAFLAYCKREAYL